MTRVLKGADETGHPKRRFALLAGPRDQDDLDQVITMSGTRTHPGASSSADAEALRKELGDSLIELRYLISQYGVR